MIYLDSKLTSSIFIEAGNRFATHYHILSYGASQNLKPELRWKKAVHKLGKIDYQKVREIELTSLALLDQERYNLFYSIEWSHHNAEWKLVCQITDDLATFFNVRSYWSEWVRFSELAVIDADLAKDPKLKAVALNNLSVAYRQLDRLSESIQCCQKSFNLCQRIGDRYGKGLSLGNLGGTYFAKGNLQASLENYNASILIFEESGEFYEQSQCLMGIGIVLARQQKLIEALSNFNACRNMQRKIGDRFGEAQTLNNVGLVQRMQKRYTEAINSFNKSLLIKQEIGDQQGIINSLSNLAVTYEQSGQTMLAISTLEKILTMLGDLNPVESERVAQRLAQIRIKAERKI